MVYRFGLKKGLGLYRVWVWGLGFGFRLWGSTGVGLRSIHRKALDFIIRLLGLVGFTV